MTSELTEDHITVTRSEGERTVQGYEQTGTSTVLDADGDAQESGRSLERLQQLHETGDVLFFSEQSVADVKPGDSATINDGTTGTVEEVRTMDDSILVTL